MQRNTGLGYRFSPTEFGRLIDARADGSPKCVFIEEIATAADVTPQTVRNWRLGKSEPTVTAACAVASVLRVGIEDLIEVRR